jgi:hypothetical protein
MSALKSAAIALLIISAILFLAMGLDVPVPFLPWRGLPARDIPIGVLLVFAGLAVARFWTIPRDEAKLLEDWQRSRKRHH